MQRDVAVGVGQQPFFIRNAYPANDDWAFTAKSVYVKTMSNSHKLLLVSGTGEVKFSQRQVFRARHFNIIRASGDQLRMEAAVLQRRGFIGDSGSLV